MKNKWKGVVNDCMNGTPRKRDTMQLYNLENDPFEQNDISHSNQEQVNVLKTMVLKSGSGCSCYQC